MLGQLPAAARFLIGFGVLLALLAFALAYNVGGIAHESSAKRQYDMSTQLLSSLQRQYDGCHDRLDRQHRGATPSAEDDQAYFQKELEERQKQRELFNGNLMELRKEAEDCRQTLLKEREEHTGTAEDNATQVILRLQYELYALMQEKENANQTKVASRETLARLIRAYQLENEELEARIKANKGDPEVDSELINQLIRGVVRNDNVRPKVTRSPRPPGNGTDAPEPAFVSAVAKPIASTQSTAPPVPPPVSTAGSVAQTAAPTSAPAA